MRFSQRFTNRGNDLLGLSESRNIFNKDVVISYKFQDTKSVTGVEMKQFSQFFHSF